MGFLSRYTGTERIDLGDGYWVETRLHLSAVQAAAAEDALYRSGAATNIGSYGLEVAVHTIVAWNLTDEDDRPLPVATESERRASLSRPGFPPFVVDRVYLAVKAATARATSEAAAFPAGRGAGAGGPGGAGSVAAVGDEAGGAVLDEVRSEDLPG